MDEVKPCPFCGGKEMSMSAFGISPDCFIMCESCGAFMEKEVPWNGMTPKQHDEECKRVLTEAWNRRVSDERA